MAEPIEDPGYWRKRLEAARAAGVDHHAVFRCSTEEWRRIEDRHREILAARIRSVDSVLDAGCGWGRLLELLPTDWRGRYLGVDLSLDFIERASERYRVPVEGVVTEDWEVEWPQRHFVVGNLRDLDWLPDGYGAYNWAILISVRPMVQRNQGGDVWEEMERNLRRVAGRLLFLEYDAADPGEVLDSASGRTESGLPVPAPRVG